MYLLFHSSTCSLFIVSSPEQSYLLRRAAKFLATQLSNESFLTGYPQLLTLTGVKVMSCFHVWNKNSSFVTTFTPNFQYDIQRWNLPSGKRFKEVGGDHSHQFNAKDVDSWPSLAMGFGFAAQAQGKLQIYYIILLCDYTTYVTFHSVSGYSEVRFSPYRLSKS